MKPLNQMTTREHLEYVDGLEIVRHYEGILLRGADGKPLAYEDVEELFEVFSRYVRAAVNMSKQQPPAQPPENGA